MPVDERRCRLSEVYIDAHLQASSTILRIAITVLPLFYERWIELTCQLFYFASAFKIHITGYDVDGSQFLLLIHNNLVIYF